VTTIAVDLSHRYFNPMGDGKFRVVSLDRTAVERITECFIEGSTCLIRHSGQTYLAVEITEGFRGQYDLTVVETKLTIVPVNESEEQKI
jgi:hypothetical protein